MEEMVPWMCLISRSVSTSHSVVDKSRLPGHSTRWQSCVTLLSDVYGIRRLGTGWHSGPAQGVCSGIAVLTSNVHVGVCRASRCGLRAISRTMLIKRREECFGRWGWEWRLTTQAKFSAASYSREWISTRADRQHLQPVRIVHGAFRVV